MIDEVIMWNYEGLPVMGRYLDRYTVGGKVIESRVKYGGTVIHYVELSKTMVINGSERTHVSLDDDEIYLVDGRIKRDPWN